MSKAVEANNSAEEIIAYEEAVAKVINSANFVNVAESIATSEYTVIN
jgi:hypothetical protein